MLPAIHPLLRTLGAALLTVSLVHCGGGSGSSTSTSSTAPSTPLVPTTPTPVTPTTPTTSTPTATTPTASTSTSTSTSTVTTPTPSTPVSNTPTSTPPPTSTVDTLPTVIAPAPGFTPPAIPTASSLVCPSTAKGPATGVVGTPATPLAQLALDKRPAALAAAIGLPARLQVGLGAVDMASVQRQSLKIDIYDRYLVGIGVDAWPNYNSPSGAYIQLVGQNADCMGAVPMFTLYQMATNGDGNLSGLTDANFMTQYWANVKLMFMRIKAYGKPTLVNFEPDFWGYAQRASSNPTLQFAYVNQTSAGDCADLDNNIVGIGNCLVRMARRYAPNAYVGFPPSLFSDLAATERSYMQRIGADKADFVVMQTLDRDIGCIEMLYAPANCNRLGDARLWDENNLTSPNFREHFALARGYFDTLGLPIVWWQTPLGVPTSTPGGTPGAFRDNRVRYFLSHAAELAAAGGLGVVFGPGHSSQTSINSDAGQFKLYSGSYLARPAALP